MSQRVYLDKKGSRKHAGRGSRSVKRKPPPNRYLLEGEEASTSASAKRLKSGKDSDIEVDASFGYRILNFIPVFSAISRSVKCKSCDSNVKFTETSIRGLGFKIKMTCEFCEPVLVSSSPQINGLAYDVNRRIVFAFRLLGIGLAGIEKFCGIMDLPKPMFRSIYEKLVNNMHVATNTVCELSMKSAVLKEKEVNSEKGDPEGLLVSADISLKKPGFSYLFGVSKIIAYYTGKIIDIAVKSRNCESCEFWKEFEDTEEYNEWKKAHDKECSASQEASSRKMDVDAIAEMFSKSEEKYGVKYTNYIDDGARKTYEQIVESQPYENVVVKKKETIDQVQQRMRTELINLKIENRGLGSRGMLTAKLIDELTAYYGLAIRSFSNSIEEMKNAIWAIFYHKISTDIKPQHDKCPFGKDSWCSWQKAKANGSLNNYKHGDPVPAEVQKAIQPVYEMMSSDDLLEGCLGGFEKTNTESMNKGIWSMAPEVNLSGEKIVEIAAYIATSIFNDGHNSVLMMMQVMNLPIGPNAQRLCEDLDQHWITIESLREQQVTKEARKLERAARKSDDDHSAAGGSL